MGEEKVTRETKSIAKEVIILIDTYSGSSENLAKQRLVCLYAERLSWTSTHLVGPNKHPQFLYRIVPEEKTSCHLIFIGLNLEYGLKETTSRKQTEHIARNQTRIDSAAEEKLAAELEEELKQ